MFNYTMNVNSRLYVYVYKCYISAAVEPRGSNMTYHRRNSVPKFLGRGKARERGQERRCVRAASLGLCDFAIRSLISA
jgi:hypothetical protein